VLSVGWCWLLHDFRECAMAHTKPPYASIYFRNDIQWLGKSERLALLLDLWSILIIIIPVGRCGSLLVEK